MQAAVEHGREHIPHDGDRHRGSTGHSVVRAAVATHRGGQEHPPGMPGVEKFVEVDNGRQKGAQELGVVAVRYLSLMLLTWLRVAPTNLCGSGT